MSNLTYNTRLTFDSDNGKQKIIKMLESQRFAWNECSKVRFEKVTQNSITELHNIFYKNFRNQNPNIPSQVIISAEQNVLSTFRSIKSNKHKIDKFPEKKSLSMRLDKRTYSFKNSVFSIISLEKRVKCKPYLYPRLQELFEKYKFCDPLIFVKNNEVWISLTFEIPDLLIKNTLALGVDLGCRINAATSEGNLYVDKKFNKRKRKLRFNKRKLQSKKTKSSKRKLKKLKHKECNVNKNFIHNLANKIIKNTIADTIIIEELKGIKKKKHKYQNKNRISQIPFFQLKQIITYKALLYKKQVITVSPRFTSQIDHRTGLKDGIRSGRRYIGKDGKILDADVNAACNIAIRSKLPCSITNYLTGQAVVNQPIVV